VEQPEVNQWDSLMVDEGTTNTLFSNDLFSMDGTETITDRTFGSEFIKATAEVGYQWDDRARLSEALDKIEQLRLSAIAVPRD